MTYFLHTFVSKNWWKYMDSIKAFIQSARMFYCSYFKQWSCIFFGYWIVYDKAKVNTDQRVKVDKGSTQVTYRT